MIATCPTCDGTGKVKLDIEAKQEDAWYPGRGDQDLWELYSHASHLKDGMWSKFGVIASFYRCRCEGHENTPCEYTINFWELGSFPIINQTRLQQEFKFINRKTGKQVRFKDPRKQVKQPV